MKTKEFKQKLRTMHAKDLVKELTKLERELQQASAARHLKHAGSHQRPALLKRDIARVWTVLREKAEAIEQKREQQ